MIYNVNTILEFLKISFPENFTFLKVEYIYSKFYDKMVYIVNYSVLEKYTNIIEYSSFKLNIEKDKIFILNSNGIMDATIKTIKLDYNKLFLVNRKLKFKSIKIN